MRTLCKSALPASLKISFFRAAVGSILLYGAEGWTKTNKLEARLDGCYTRRLMMVLDLNWERPSHQRGNLWKPSKSVRSSQGNTSQLCCPLFKTTGWTNFWTSLLDAITRNSCPRGDQGWRIPSSFVKTLAWNLKTYSKIHHGQHSSEVDESK